MDDSGTDSSPAPSAAVAAWTARGQVRTLDGLDIFTVDLPATGLETAEPLLVLHGFPTSSFDFRHIVDDQARHRRVCLLDLAGYGLSSKPDRRYSIELQADLVAAFVVELGLERLALLTHDMGDTVGGELLARNLVGTWPVDVTRRILTNGSIYLALTQLSVGQQLLLELPDEALTGDGLIDGPAMAASLTATFSPAGTVDRAELDAQWALISRAGGHLLLPRLIRYVEDRRLHEDRYTGAIETHPSPVSVIWGADDPIAVLAMTARFVEARPDAAVTVLDGVGHFPMIEAPDRFLAAVTIALAGSS